MRSKYLIYSAMGILFLILVNDICYADDNRKGFIFSAGLGGGYTNVSSAFPLNNGFSTFGLGLTGGSGLSVGAGYEFTNKVAVQCDWLYTSSYLL